MTIKQKIKVILVGAFLLFGAFTLFPAVPEAVQAASCGGVETALVSCSETGGEGSVENTGLWGVLKLAIQVLTAAVAVAALGGIVWGAILYTSAGGSVEQTKKAINVILNVVIGVVAYGLMFVGLNFLIPGGVFDL